MNRVNLGDIAGISLLLAVVLSLIWVGFLASDDWHYLEAAQGWLSQFPFIASHHHALRHSLVLPMAASLALLGESEFSVVIATTAYFFLLVMLTYFIVERIFDRKLALWVSVLLATSPLFAVHATIAGVDIPQVFFALLSLWLFYRATHAPQPALVLVGGGIAAGLAWLSHETVAALLLFYGLLFLRGTHLRRRMYGFMALGFLAVFTSEALYYFVMVGDPFHRISALLQVIHRGPPSLAPNYGYPCEISSSRVVCTTLNLFTQAEFGLLFYLAIPAGWVVCRSESLTPEQRRFIKLVAGLAIVWFVFVSYVVELRPRPRFYMMPTYLSIVLVATWFGVHLKSRSTALAWTVPALLISSNALCLYMSNRVPMFGERALADFVASSQQTVYTDPRLAERASKFLEWKAEGLVDRLRTEPPPPGSVYFYYERTVLAGYVAGGERFDVDRYRVPQGAQVIWRRTGSRTLVGDLLDVTGVAPYLPAALARKLLRPYPDATAYGVPPGLE